jgi:hypothetical protein
MFTSSSDALALADFTTRRSSSDSESDDPIKKREAPLPEASESEDPDESLEASDESDEYPDDSSEEEDSSEDE